MGLPVTESAAQRRIALLLEYEGTRYAGSQFQANAATIQGELEAAIGKATGERARASFAGRTDSGVHALGQVAAFTTTSRLDPQTMRDALNAWLPRDIAVLAAADADLSFDPRRQALRRTYRYVIENRAVRPAIGRDLCWYVAKPLDIEAMQAAAPALVGEHDFAAFGGALEEPGASTVRRLEAFEVRREGSRVTIEVTANAFLPHQVRRMTGALVQVGLGRLTPEAYGALLVAAPSSAGPAAPARGLYLVRVEYERDPFA
ncbi:MAG TPA: tRNA pseudouridine(38-40) synthase TruA [Dehalococcoidia bacterium]|nr:tRNA pseudouridine(38-40) synthase TruA [Dehalococcoidia bacterium]